MAAATTFKGVPTTSKKRLPDALSRHQPPQLDLPTGTVGEVGVWMQERAQTLWDGGMPDEAAAIFS